MMASLRAVVNNNNKGGEDEWIKRRIKSKMRGQSRKDFFSRMSNQSVLSFQVQSLCGKDVLLSSQPNLTKVE